MIFVMSFAEIASGAELRGRRADVARPEDPSDARRG